MKSCEWCGTEFEISKSDPYPAIILSLMGKRREPLTNLKLLGAVIPARLSSFIAIYTVIKLKAMINAVTNMKGDSDAYVSRMAEHMSGRHSIGISLYLLCVIGFAIAIVGFVMKIGASLIKCCWE